MLGRLPAAQALLCGAERQGETEKDLGTCLLAQGFLSAPPPPPHYSDSLSADVGKRNCALWSLSALEKQIVFGNVFYSTRGSCKKTLNDTDATKCLVSISESPSP